MWIVDVITRLDLILKNDATLNLLITFSAYSLNSTIPHHFANVSTSYVTTTINVCETMNYLLSTSLTIITSIHSNSMGHNSILVNTIHFLKCYLFISLFMSSLLSIYRLLALFYL